MIAGEFEDNKVMKTIVYKKLTIVNICFILLTLLILKLKGWRTNQRIR